MVQADDVRELTRHRLEQALRDSEQLERAARAAAELQHARAHLKSDITLALVDITQSAELTPALRRVAELMLLDVACTCIVHVEDRGRVLRVSAHRGPHGVRCVETWLERRAARPRQEGPFAVMRTGQAELREGLPEGILADLLEDAECLAALRAAPVTSYLCVPLPARQRVTGAVTLLLDDPHRRYGEDDLIFVQEVAERIALAVDNGRLYRETQEAKIAAERLYEAEQRARAEAEALFRVADAISATQLDLEALVQRVTDESTALVGAQLGAFFYDGVNESGEACRLFTVAGVPREAFAGLGMPNDTALFAETLRGGSVVRIDDVREDPRHGRRPPHHGLPSGHLPVTSYLAVPVVSRTGVVIGGLFFGHPEPARFDEQHERMARTLAAHAAIALDNARLFRATRAAEERQSRLVRELERTVRFSEMFVGILGHDLRNPLSAITTAASLILNRSEAEHVRRPARRILSSSDRMSRMIDQILDFTHVRLGHGIPLRRRDVDLGDICRLVIDELRGAGKDAEVRLEVMGDTTGCWDPDRLAQLVSNLAGNGVQHRTPGSAVLVTLDGTDRARVVLELHNEGVIPPELLPVIFEPLCSGGSRKREGSSGLGLGLYISHEIAIAHGGTIRVRSEAASGTRFTVDLPRAPAEQVDKVFGTGGAGERRGET